MARQRHEVAKRNWLVVAPLNKAVVPAEDEEAAKLLVLRNAGLGNKPYLARDWSVREATAEEIKRYAVWADNWRPSQSTAKTVKRPRRPVEDRLV